MAYQVLARKWRPQSFEDVVGQKTVTQTLQNAIASGRLAHAFLLSGVRGVGKTTTARILAKALNCGDGPTPSPCGECVSCKEIAAANSLDVMEIDAASNTGVDNIRELRESVRYTTSRDRFKIYIIDEVHMLSNAAFNALLKTLEEPPPHVKFILATTEHHKIPVTIISRCQHFDLKPIPFQLILDRLRFIGRKEGLEISDYALRMIVSTAQGSMRDAQSVLDQTIAFCGKRVRDKDVQVLLGVVGDGLLSSVVEAVVQRDTKTLLECVRKLGNNGIEAQNFCQQLIVYLRNLLVCKVAGWDERLLHLPDSEKETLLKQSDKFSELDLIRFYDLLNRTRQELRWHSNSHIHLEMALVKLVKLGQLPTLEQIIRQFESSSTPPRIEKAVQPATKTQANDPLRITQKNSSAKNNPEKSPDQFVSQLLAALQGDQISLYSSLQHASRISLTDGKVSILFPASEAFHHGIITDEANTNIINQLCSALMGSPLHLQVELEEEISASSLDPTEDARVKIFMEQFPGKVIVDTNGED